MKTKKILSLVMALAMALSLAATAWADTPTLDTAPSTKSADSLQHAAQYTGNTTVPTIDLAVAGVNSTLGFNPYKLAVRVDDNGVPKSDGGKTANDQFITKEIKITNKTNVPLKLEGSFKVTPYVDSTANPPSDATAATLSNKALAATETAKKIYAYADFYTYDDDYDKVPDATKTACAGYRLTAATGGTAVQHADKSRVVMQATDGTTPNYVYVKVNGEATNAPTTPWETYDKVQIDFVFKFQSQPNFDKYAVINNPASSDTIDEYTVTPTYSKSDVLQAKGTDDTDLAKGKTGNTVAGYTCYVTPNSGYQITNVKFYDKTGKTAITTVKATSTNTKDKTAPWTFVMPADNVFIQVIGSTVPNT